LCYIACWDGAHQCIHLDRTPSAAGGNGHRRPVEVESESRRKIAWTPTPRLDLGPGPTPLERIPRVDEDECVGCNLCWLVCPVENCITMEKVENGLPPETWAERVSRKAAR